MHRRMLDILAGFLGLLVLVVLPSLAQAQDSLRVSTMVFCRAVENRQPQDVAASFADTVQQVFCFTRIEGASGEIQIRHRWFWGDSLMAEVVLPVRSASWRTWSSKRMVPGWRGEWRVQVIGPDNAVLREERFTFGKGD